MKDFINDMIHMTEGEKLIYYWPLWLSIIVVVIIAVILVKRKFGGR